MSETFVLDSFAVLALLGKEPSGEEVAGLLRRAQEQDARVLMTWANVGEVAYIVERRWGVGRVLLGVLLRRKIGVPARGRGGVGPALSEEIVEMRPSKLPETLDNARHSFPLLAEDCAALPCGQMRDPPGIVRV